MKWREGGDESSEVNRGRTSGAVARTLYFAPRAMGSQGREGAEGTGFSSTLCESPEE